VKNLFSLLALLFALQGFAQHRDQKIYFLWGYNRSWYNKSDIHLKGEGYDFTIHDAIADDMPEELSWVYLDPGKFSIPQFNFRAGYYINENWSISAGWDHMKYVMRNGQTAKISGYIHREAIDETAMSTNPQVIRYVGEYDDDDVLLSREFLKYEHTDGLNFVRVALERTTEVANLYDGKFNICWQNAVGTGPVLPWTDFRMLSGKRWKNRLHFSGWGVGVQTGVRLEFLKSFYLQSMVSAGYINLFDVEQKMHESDTGDQEISYVSWDVVAGAYINWKRILKRERAN